MALQIQSSPSDPDAVAKTLRDAISQAIPDAAVEVRATGAAHFEIAVTSASFAGESRLKQQQAVYAAIAHLMKGASAPVHAVDKLETRAP